MSWAKISRKGVFYSTCDLRNELKDTPATPKQLELGDELTAQFPGAEKPLTGYVFGDDSHRGMDVECFLMTSVQVDSTSLPLGSSSVAGDGAIAAQMALQRHAWNYGQVASLLRGTAVSLADVRLSCCDHSKHS